MSKRPIRQIHPVAQRVYTYGAQHPPLTTVKSGETVEIHCVDSADNCIQHSSDLPSEKLKYPYLNPQTGPVIVEGAEPGDSLAVKIHKITPTTEWAWSALIPHFGALTETPQTAMLHDPLPEKVWIYPLKGGQVHLRNGIKIPFQPFAGTMGTAPQIESISSLAPGNHGGNMDCADICPGNTVLFPVRAEGAHFMVGDLHAAQGDGELCGVACEMAGAITLTFHVLKKQPINWPRVISDDFIMSIGSARPLEDAVRIATQDVVMWMEADFGFDRWEAFQLLSQVCQLRIANMVDTTYSVVATFPQRYLPKNSKGMKTLRIASRLGMAKQPHS